jgi:ATP-dependent DNA ligase
MKINKFTYFYPEKPRLISVDQALFAILNDKSEVVAEKKYNGIRLQLHCMPDGTFQFWNRHNTKIQYIPSDELLDSLNQMGCEGYNIFDGELRHAKTKGVQHKIVLFDVFAHQGVLLNKRPFWNRRGVLEGYNFVNDNLKPAEQFDSDFLKIFNEVTKVQEIEGLVMKNKTGMLELGRKAGVSSKWMWKVRRPTKNYRF